MRAEKEKKAMRQINPEKKRKKISGREWQWIQMSIFPVLHTFIFSYCTLYGLLIAFKDYKYSLGIWGSKWVGLNNFKFFVLSNDCLRLVKNTISLNALFIVTIMAAEIALAIVFYEITSRRALKAYQTILITPNFISWVTVGYVVYAFLQPQYGIVNNILRSLGLEGIQFYNEPAVWPAILNFAQVWKGVGMGCIIYYATLMGIDNTLYEAARIDGASNPRIFWQVTLPLSKPIIVYTMLTQFAWPWSDFILPSLLLKNKDLWTVAVGLMSLDETKFTRFAAGSVFIGVPIILLYFCLSRFLVQGLSSGAVKE